MVFYGLGVTIGAGIFVLLGATVGRAGIHAPISFLLAAVVVLFSAASFAELATRFPVSAGEAAYVREGLRSPALSLLVGLFVILVGLVSAAAITIGSVGYLREFVALPEALLIIVILLALGAVAAWGVVESLRFAAVFTLLEIGALLAVVAAGLQKDPGLLLDLPRVLPPSGDLVAWSGIAGAGLLAFFAFVGFEDIVNLAEEIEQPERVLPRAIFLTLGLSMLLYFLVAAVAVLSVPLEELAESPAPLSFVFSHVTGASPLVITAIAVVATLNGVVIQIVMASRVLYGLGHQGSLPAVFARVHAVTRTPLMATAFVTAVVLALALLFPLDGLAEMTSRIVLVNFALVNAALLRLKFRAGYPAAGAFTVGTWVPAAGLVTCLAFLASDLLG